MYKDEIKDFPPEIVEKMLYYQEEQGSKRDVTVFEKSKNSDRAKKGFDWTLTKEGFDFWYRISTCNNFDLFFERYPKQNFVCGVALEHGKDYYIKIRDDCERVIRFDRIKDNIVYKIYSLSITTKNFYLVPGCWGIISEIKSIRPATIQESEHLNACREAGKYVDMPKHEKEAVHCKTQEEWDFVTEKLGYVWSTRTWSICIEKSCIRTDTRFSSSLDVYKEKNVKIYSFEDWCEKFGHSFKSSETTKNKTCSPKKDFKIFKELTSKKESQYKVEDGYLPYPEPVVNLVSIFSQITD